ncbi:Hypothetical predicted protein, partial [Pelobates cultripes]
MRPGTPECRACTQELLNAAHALRNFPNAAHAPRELTHAIQMPWNPRTPFGDYRTPWGNPVDSAGSQKDE